MWKCKIFHNIIILVSINLKKCGNWNWEIYHILQIMQNQPCFICYPLNCICNISFFCLVHHRSQKVHWGNFVQIRTLYLPDRIDSKIQNQVCKITCQCGNQGSFQTSSPVWDDFHAMLRRKKRVPTFMGNHGKPWKSTFLNVIKIGNGPVGLLI